MAVATREEVEKIKNAPRGVLTNVDHYYPEFNRDQSHLVGRMDSISFPETEEDIQDQLIGAASTGTPVTLQGMRTGITGGAVPQGGHALNVNKMRRIRRLRRGSNGTFVLTLEPGVLMRGQIWHAAAGDDMDTDGWSAESLQALDELRRTGPYLFAPDPSEPTIAIAGIVANNSCGARSFHYGAARRHVERVRVVLTDGVVLALKRGECRASGRSFWVKCDTGRVIAGTLPGYGMPPVKNSAGYFVQDNMDLVDLFVGSEGTLGVFSEVDVRLVPAPAEMTGVMVFLPSESSAFRLAAILRSSVARPVAIEYFDQNAVGLLRSRPDVFKDYQMEHEFPPGPVWAVYVEYHSPDRESEKGRVEELLGGARRCGGDPGLAWVESGEEAVANYKQIKHLLPEVVNGIIGQEQAKEPSIRKLGTDWAVPADRLDALMAHHHADLEAHGLEHLAFGHLGDCNLHVNIIPRSAAQFETGARLCREWARTAVELGGTVSAEHGIGKVKRAMLEDMYGLEHIEAMRRLKRLFDPDGILNRGNIFEM